MSVSFKMESFMVKESSASNKMRLMKGHLNKVYIMDMESTNIQIIASIMEITRMEKNTDMVGY